MTSFTIRYVRYFLCSRYVLLHFYYSKYGIHTASASFTYMLSTWRGSLRVYRSLYEVGKVPFIYQGHKIRYNMDGSNKSSNGEICKMEPISEEFVEKTWHAVADYSLSRANK